MGISCRNLSVVETPVECTMVFKISSAVILATTILVVDSINLHTNYQEEFEFSPAQYSFEYGVRDGEVGVNYGQQETRAGTVTTGSYSVALPDGRIEKVHYTVDPVGGYEAVVTYEGGAGEQPLQQAGYPQYSVLG